MIASLYQSESDIVWDFRRDAVSDAMGSCMCHLARLGDRTPGCFNFRQRDDASQKSGSPYRSAGQRRLVAKLGGQSSQRLICARFITSCERMELAMTVLETHYHGRNCLAKVPIEQGL